MGRNKTKMNGIYETLVSHGYSSDDGWVFSTGYLNQHKPVITEHFGDLFRGYENVALWGRKWSVGFNARKVSLFGYTRDSLQYSCRHIRLKGYVPRPGPEFLARMKKVFKRLETITVCVAEDHGTRFTPEDCFIVVERHLYNYAEGEWISAHYEPGEAKLRI